LVQFSITSIEKEEIRGKKIVVLFPLITIVIVDYYF